MTDKFEIDLVFDKKYRNIRDEFAAKHFNNNLRDVCLFALALGINRDLRVPKTDWDGPLSWTDMNRLKGDNKDFMILFEYMDSDGDEKSVKQRMDEFVTGGLKFIHDNDLLDDGSLREIEIS